MLSVTWARIGHSVDIRQRPSRVVTWSVVAAEASQLSAGRQDLVSSPGPGPWTLPAVRGC